MTVESGLHYPLAVCVEMRSGFAGSAMERAFQSRTAEPMVRLHSLVLATQVFKNGFIFHYWRILMRVLIAEDDVALASFVRKGLEAEHYAVDVSHDGEQTRAMAGELDYDLLMLDLNLPGVDGIAILRHLRTRKPSMPILVLTSRNRVEDRVQCLDLGADDYLGKPFSYAELSARIRALLRRCHLPAASVVTVEDLKLDRVERRVERAGKRIELTTKEFALLEYLMLNAGRRVSRPMIIEHVWNLSFDTSTNVVDVYVNYGLRVTEVLAGPQLAA
jgi:two-component system, OmpR family, copper resistance phosphate regulon response regulator CusR